MALAAEAQPFGRGKKKKRSSFGRVAALGLGLLGSGVAGGVAVERAAEAQGSFANTTETNYHQEDAQIPGRAQAVNFLRAIDVIPPKTAARALLYRLSEGERQALANENPATLNYESDDEALAILDRAKTQGLLPEERRRVANYSREVQRHLRLLASGRES